MTDNDERFARQLKLADVGPEGQARILALRATLADAPGSSVEREYLRRAGVRHFESSAGTEPFIHRAHFHSPASRAVAFGAWRALNQLRSALELDSAKG